MIIFVFSTRTHFMLVGYFALFVTLSIRFWPVFHVTDQQGNKITDSKTIDYIEKV